MVEYQRAGSSTTDMATMLAARGSRLLAAATTLRGLAHERGDEGSDEGRVERGLAGGLEDTARLLDLVKSSLCPACRLLEVGEDARIEAGEDLAAARRRPIR